MTDLRPEDFAAYFRDVHGGNDPFPWQGRLLRQVIAQGWPSVLDLPTGTGKTAVIDVALFHLALEAAADQRRAPLRIVLVVDRRTVVDQAYARAEKIVTALRAGATPVVRLMTERLGRLGGDEPLALALLRGGIVRDDRWARSPAQPLVAVSTVDQVGSRLLFRGYGVSRSMRPVHAGLLGNDTLFLLDEVHLSEPFRQTLDAIAGRYRAWVERPLPERWRVVSMSATPSGDARDRFGLDDEDRAHPVLRRRLTASKPVELVEVRVTGEPAVRAEKFADRLADEAAPPADVPGAAIAVVVNRVRTARLVYERLRARHAEVADVHLLTGRMRPIDRKDVEAEIVERVRAGRSPRRTGDRATIVVATQCIEAGADFDFDVLVTECASLDALQQRFGRLNRLGDAEHCRGSIVIRSDHVGEDDPIYGAARSKTWQFLRGLGRRTDFGLDALHVPAEIRGSLVVQSLPAPVLLPAHLDTWVQTSQVPEPDPDVALWLHGSETAEAEVQIVWRADVDADLFEAAGDAGEAAPGLLERVLERVEVCPPQVEEVLSVPMSAARRWLAHQASEDRPADDIADVEGGRREPVPERSEPMRSRAALAWRGERSEVVHPNRWRVVPGDTLVVPSAYGGLLDRNWAPEATDHVSDVGDRAANGTGRLVLRLHPEVWRFDVGATTAPPPPCPPADGADEADERGALTRWLQEAESSDLPGWLGLAVERLREARGRRVVRVSAAPSEVGGVDDPDGPAGGYYVLIGRQGETTTDDETSSFTGVEVTLDKHLRGVGAVARGFARSCGLPAHLVAALEMAGRWHDAGKADRRFQRMLHGGNPFKAAAAEQLLAKSSIAAADRRAREWARERSRYPRGCRHELMSLALMLADPSAIPKAGDVDFDLVLHLVSSHHGWCRPLPPVAIDDGPVDVGFEIDGVRVHARSDHGLERLDSGVSDRFFRLIRRYGWFGLAWLEAILRLADHRRSEREQRADEGRDA